MTRLHLLSLLVLCAVLAISSISCPRNCVTQSLSNPIRDQYPTDIVGTLNGTLVAWLVDLDYAKSLVPAEYPLLLHAAKDKYPDLPDGKFPLFSDIVMNFDGGVGDYTMEPFHRIRANVPFVDRLKDNYTSFRLNLPIAISQSVIDASAVAGVPLSDAYASTFDPPCNGYGAGKGSQGGPIYSQCHLPAMNMFQSTALSMFIADNRPEDAYLVNETTPVFTSRFHEGSEPFGLAFFRNISNQPAFGAGLKPSVCAQGISFYNTSLTTGQFEPVAIRGSATFLPPLLPSRQVFREMYGYKLDVAFLERQFSNCADLQGYAGTGSGDSG